MASDNPVPAPTPADLARDLAADLAKVEAATAGWDWLEESWTNHGEETLFRFAVFREVDECQVIVCYAPVVSQIGCQDDEASDIHAIAASREAWPAAIRRALHAEAECERLRARLNGLALAAGGTVIADGDTTCTLGWWVHQVLTEGHANG